MDVVPSDSMDDENEELIARIYQTELEDIAVSRNSIIHLPTGSGKTFIAIRLINRLREALKPPWGEGGKRTFFLVNTVPLVEQQKKVIGALCTVKTVAGYSGEDRVDFWNKSKWDQELSDHQVIVMTSQILADMLTHAYIRVQDINLVIFDECHHAVIDHPMRNIMKHFESCPVEKQPRVLGLTATLLNGNVNVNKVEEILRELEKTFRATISTSNEMSIVSLFSTKPNEVIITYNTTPPTEAAEEAIAILAELQEIIRNHIIPPPVTRDITLGQREIDITTDPKKIVKLVSNMTVNMINYIHDLGVYGGSLGILASTIALERMNRKAKSSQEEELYKFTITHITLARTILLKSMEKEEGFEKIVKHSSDKVVKLLNILREYNPDTMNAPGVASRVNLSRKPLSGIVFTRQRFTAKILYNLLKDVKSANPQDYGFLKHEFVVGFNVNPRKCTREDHFNKKYSEKAILDFSNNELNLLIATNVLEEGLDIQQCVLVLKYDEPVEYRSYIQSKGRARCNQSTYAILVSAAEYDKFKQKYSNYQKVEKFIQQLLVGKTDERNEPTDEEVSEVYTENEIPPYVTEHGTRLLPASAIGLINRYCNNLPHDQFTLITPMWVQENVTYDGVPMKLIHISLPVSCPIKERITGIPLVQRKNAKRAAALEACKRLHQEGELDKWTLLPHEYGVVDYDDEVVTSCFPNWKNEEVSENLPRPGTKKMIRRHNKIFPKLLNGPTNDWNTGTEIFYLHVIQFKTSFPMPTDTREQACYELLHQDEGFGFLTMHSLPKMCDFPMFVMMGEINTSIRVNYATIPLDRTLFDVVKYFHLFLFDQILNVAKKFVVFDGSQNSLFVVPLKGSQGEFDIDWDVMLKHKEIPPLVEPTFDERKNLIVIPEEYHKHIVSPWYRGSLLPTRYVVSKVLEYKSPQSQLDSSESLGTFEQYFLNKYHLEILGDKQQPLLEVRHLSPKMNCLFPRAATIKEFSDKQKKLISMAHGDDSGKQFSELFIPEFCIKYDFPAVLWYKATILPCIIHRVTMILVAFELQTEIAEVIKYGVVVPNPDEVWAPIKPDKQIAIQSMLSQVEERAPCSNNIDRINNPIDDSIPAPKIISMKESIYRLKKQQINENYPWEEEQEPIDIERNMNTVTVMDIECYDEFVSCVMPVSKSNPNTNRPIQREPIAAAAICAAPLSQSSNIPILSRQPINRGPELKDVLAAITTIKSNDTFNLERAETMGDSFLKFIASLYLFHKFPRMNEGQLTNLKSRLIGNRNLYYAGERINLAGRMKVENFSPRKDFLVPGFFAHSSIKELIHKNQVRPTVLLGLQVSPEEAVTGELTAATLESISQRIAETEKEPSYCVQNSMQCYIGSQAVPDKSVADCVEALIGTYLQAGGLLAAIKVLEFFRVLPKEDNVSSMLKRKVPTVLSENKSTLSEVHRVLNNCHEEVEQIMNYKFKDPALLLEALSHPSYIRNRLTSGYERLEFLGDAILDFLVTAHIFELGQNLKPGELTDLRSALVNNVTFATYVVKLGLQKLMYKPYEAIKANYWVDGLDSGHSTLKRLCSNTAPTQYANVPQKRCIGTQMNTSLEGAIIKFVDHQERRNHALEEDVLHLIDETDCQVAEYVEVPKLLSDVFESLAAAIYLDSGGDLQVVWDIYYAIMKNEINKFFACIPKQPVRLLYENIHACPVFEKPIVVNPDVHKLMVAVTFTKNGARHTVHGVGNNKFEAKRAAAKIALKVLSM